MKIEFRHTNTGFILQTKREHGGNIKSEECHKIAKDFHEVSKLIICCTHCVFISTVS